MRPEFIGRCTMLYSARRMVNAEEEHSFHRIAPIDSQLEFAPDVEGRIEPVDMCRQG